ncbi:MAG: hypothetical protein M1838_003669 [Thelocarpon superellum]|nr:MAG: hypothetical protein M1838_003669 [Thelocarpon superellum]
MALPPIAPFPPAEVRMQMMPEEWDSCLESWSILTKLLLERPDDDFTGIATRDAGLIAFLCSYVHEASRVHGSDGRLDTPHARTLRRHVFLLCHRCLLHVQPIPARLLGWDFLTSFCGTYARSSSLKGLLHHLWQQRRQQLDGTFTKVKGDITERLEMRGKEKARVLEDDLTRLGYLFRTSPDVSRLFMIGSDFLDALSTAFTSSSGTLRRKVVAVTYLGLTSLTEGDHPNFSLLFDHLYTLKSVVESRGSSEHDTLLSDLISNTPFLLHLQDRIHGAEAARAKSLFAYLERFPKTARARRRMSVRKQGQKGKSPAVGNLTEDGFSHDLYAHIHVHRMSLISQVQDLFPNLGAAFVMKLLDEYGENVEQVIGHLLEDSLPPHLKQADHSKELTPKPHHAHFIPRSTPSPPPSLPTTRRNIHDNDELSTLSVPLSRLQFGRKDGDLTADALLQDRSTAPGKAAILSALAAFDSDDDEHDDTYDAEDDGGVVGSSIDSDVTGPRVHNETGGNSAGHNPRTDADVPTYEEVKRDAPYGPQRVLRTKRLKDGRS